MLNFLFVTDTITGSSIDWVYDVLGVKYSYELSLRGAGGTTPYILPADQIVPTGKETSDGFYAAIIAMK